MDSSDFTNIILGNSTNRMLLEQLPKTGLKDAWLVSGCLFQTYWNAVTGRDASYGIKDYDIFYFDSSDLSWEAEDRAIRAAVEIFGDAGAVAEIRNQARVHLWYEEKFGLPYKALGRATEGVDHFLATTCMFAIRRTAADSYDVYAPKGFDDLEKLIVRPNSVQQFDVETYRKKAARWCRLWPELTFIDVT